MLLNVNALAKPLEIVLLFTFGWTGEDGTDELRDEAFDDESGDDFLIFDLNLLFLILVHWGVCGCWLIAVEVDEEETGDRRLFSVSLKIVNSPGGRPHEGGTLGAHSEWLWIEKREKEISSQIDQLIW